MCAEFPSEAGEFDNRSEPCREAQAFRSMPPSPLTPAAASVPANRSATVVMIILTKSFAAPSDMTQVRNAPAKDASCVGDESSDPHQIFQIGGHLIRRPSPDVALIKWFSAWGDFYKSCKFMSGVMRSGGDSSRVIPLLP